MSSEESAVQAASFQKALLGNYQGTPGAEEEGTIAEKIAERTVDLDFGVLDSKTVTEAKTLLLDSLGAIIVGVEGVGQKDPPDPPKMVRQVYLEAGGPPEATVIGTGKKAWCPHAAVMNGVALRYPEYAGHLMPPGVRITVHCEEVIPGALAVSEKVGARGKDLITSIVLGAELQTRFAQLFVPYGLRVTGLHFNTLAIFVAPLVVGKLMGLNAQQLAHAFCISASFGIQLEEQHRGNCPSPSQSRNIMYPFATQNGIIAAMLASQGYMGPKTVFEGPYGFLRLMGAEGEKGRTKLDQLVTKFQSPFMINYYNYKHKSGDKDTQLVGDISLNLKHEHNIDHRNIKEIKLYLTTRIAYATVVGDFKRNRSPKYKEMADHGVLYTFARAMIDGDIQFPEQYTPDKLNDPEVIKLIDKIKVYGDPQLDAEANVYDGPAYAEVHMNDGRVYKRRDEIIKGYGPLRATEEEVKYKFRHRAALYLNEDVIEQIIEAVDNLENAKSIVPLMNLMQTFQKSRY